jgi:hypothetical protein
MDTSVYQNCNKVYLSSHLHKNTNYDKERRAILYIILTFIY